MYRSIDNDDESANQVAKVIKMRTNMVKDLLIGGKKQSKLLDYFKLAENNSF